MINVGSKKCRCGNVHENTQLIAVTGGPGAGKTAVLQMAQRSFCRHVAFLPEAASVIFGGGFPRHSTYSGRCAAQRAIFYVQREAERLALEEGRFAAAFCDRGTVDGSAYWPGEPAELFGQVGTSLAEQVARYAAVIHLRTPDGERGYNHDNPLRKESAEEAARIDERIAEVWQGHPNRFVIDSADDFADKAVQALALLQSEVPECCRR